MKILVTGTAGFIGSYSALALLNEGHEVIGLDNINNYYDVEVKYGRLERSGIQRKDIKENYIIQSNKHPGYRFIKMNLENKEVLDSLFKCEKFDKVLNLAAQAGVRYSLTNPYAYINSNIIGFQNILEACRYNDIEHLIYASSSSVYGLNNSYPFKTSDNVNTPISIYAATKRANELMAHSYSHLYRLPTTGIRFFTVYGPWGRPDLSLYIFTKAILEGKPINIFNNGDMKRDFTYIDDTVSGILKIIDSIPQGNDDWDRNNPSVSSAPFKLYNIGNNAPVNLMDFVDAIEDTLGIKAKRNYLSMQPGDVKVTWTDVNDLITNFNYAPSVSVKEGVKRFISWYLDYFKISL